ncbi:DUF1127 domain-containing protein [Pararhodospirillum oryzae]|uniref:YjiS-like domain-containing protein n=1 Tax=Pararhodospirillum oryzae TaxID=478448 RepID=A0A512H7F0_9PROT|nr:DUF1127 domain-containing protein [Pararhodospirillum oryzae]GEO81310.1 hypothetical protein ROR02_14410 [Pararhodospirillum oryzae]
MVAHPISTLHDREVSALATKTCAPPKSTPSVLGQMEGWLARQYDVMAARRERQESAAMLSRMDERMLADIGYGNEDSQRIRMG